MTSSSYLAMAILPPRFPPRDPKARADLPVPTFPPAFLAFLGVVLLVAGGSADGGAAYVSLSLGLILAALVWVALMLVAELYAAAPTPCEER